MQIIKCTLDTYFNIYLNSYSSNFDRLVAMQMKPFKYLTFNFNYPFSRVKVINYDLYSVQIFSSRFDLLFWWQQR